MTDETTFQLIRELIAESKTAFIGSIDANGFPNMKAMLTPRLHQGLRTFYFSTNTSSMRVSQFQTNSKACIYFCNEAKFLGLMLRGHMEVLTDAESKQLIWQEGDTMYYPLGVTDPDYCVLRFTAIDGRLYRDFHSENIDIE